MAVRHAGYANGQGNGDGGRQSFGNGAHRQGHRCHEHVDPVLSPEKPHQKRDTCQPENGIQQQMAELRDFGSQRCGNDFRRRYQVIDAADLGMIPRGNDDPPPGPVGDQGGGIGHVSAVRQVRVRFQTVFGLLDRHALPGQRAFVDAQFPGFEQAHVRRHLVTGLDQDNVAGHQFQGRHFLPLTVPEHQGFAHHGPGQGINGL